MNESIICKRNIEVFGKEHIKDVAIEECTELIQALIRERRGRNVESDVVTEIADVQIMCEQLMQIYGRKEVTQERYRKLRRQEMRIRKHLRNKDHSFDF